MQSTFTGIEIGKRSLVAHNAGLTTIGHNLSNASVEGYSRQRVQMTAYDPIYAPELNREEAPGQIGQGVMVESIKRVHDQILEGRIVSQANGEGYWGAKDKYLLMVEQVYNEPKETSLRTRLDEFWEGWQELSLHPEEMASRKTVISRGETLIDSIHQQYYGLKQIRDMVEEDVSATVKQVNSLLHDISALNEQIVKVKAMGDNPNDLLDKRDLLVKKLSGFINISVDNRDPDEYTVTTGGYHLIQGRVITGLKAVPDPKNEGYSTVQWAENGETAQFSGGKLAALIELRDSDVKSEIQNLDTLTINFLDLVNENHRAGYGLNGKTGLDFFTEYPFVNNVAGNYDSNGDGAFDSTYLFRISGNNVLSPQDQVGLRGKMILSGSKENVTVDYYPTDTVEDIVKRINMSGSEVVARFNKDGKLQLKASAAADPDNPDFVIRHIEDSGEFLAGYAGILISSGVGGAYNFDQADAVAVLRGGELDYAVTPTSHPAAWLEVNRSIKADPDSIAAGFGVNGHPANSGDGSAAIAIASLRNSDVMVGRTPNFDEYFATTVANAGLKGEAASQALETEELIMKKLQDLKDSISGVNIDEELSQMIKFQHGYNAASRFVSEVNKMLDTIINRMGV